MPQHKALKFSKQEVAAAASLNPNVTEYKRIVFAEVYTPMRPDSDGEFMTAGDIEQMAHDFIANNNSKQIDMYHDNVLVQGAAVVESFIARKGDPTYIEGAWVVGVRVLNDAVWEDILNGSINGFSMEAMVEQEEVAVEFTAPSTITGFTTTDAGHSHRFAARYDNDGNFLGGETDFVDGHKHKITVGSVTAYAPNGDAVTHRHRFSAVENLEIVETGEPVE